MLGCATADGKLVPDSLFVSPLHFTLTTRSAHGRRTWKEEDMRWFLTPLNSEGPEGEGRASCKRASTASRKIGFVVPKCRDSATPCRQTPSPCRMAGQKGRRTPKRRR